jgi:diguanylate cyclase (GGDEF)-like protein
MMRGDRLGLLQLARVVIGLSAIAAVAFSSSLPPTGREMVPALVAWMAVTVAAEAARRSGHIRSLTAPLAMLVVDGLVLGYLIAHTGGHRSPLLGFVYLHVVAVSLLVSHRVALRLAVWHGFILFAGFVLAASHSVDLQLAAGEDATSAGQHAALHATGFLLVAVGVAACSALNEQVVQRTQRELAAIADVGGVLSGTLDVDTAMASAARALRAALGAERVAIMATDGNDFRAAVSDERTTTALAATDAELAGAVRDVRGPQQLRDLASSALESVVPLATNVVVVPFRAGRNPGVVLLVCGGGQRTRLPQTTVTTVGNVATLIGTTLENARLHERVEQLATHDGLTGLANRRVFDEELAADVRRVHRGGAPFSLVVFDVDHFKSVNDEHGHQAGDEVLRRVAAALADATRDTDLAARYGGEEFVVLLRGCDRHHALAAADKLRRAAVLLDGPVPVTVSAGVASFPDQAANASALVEAADHALYEAKRSGRDQTRIAARRRLHITGACA